jgi:hypothetical protein
MSSALDRCRDLHTRLTEHDGRNRAAREAEAFRERSKELRVVQEALASALAKASVLRARTIVLPGDLRDPTPVVAALQAARQKLDDETSSFNTGREYGQLKRSLEKLEKDASTVVGKALEAVKRDLPAIDEAFLRLVEAVPGHEERVAEIRAKREQLFEGTDVAALDAGGLAEFLDRRQELRLLADSLRPSEFPLSVLEFFKSARQASGAPLQKLTDEVRNWLEQHDLLKQIRITILDR